MFSLIVHSSAEEDIENAVEWHEEQQPGLERAFLHEFLQQLYSWKIIRNHFESATRI